PHVKIAAGSDHAGFSIKEAVVRRLRAQGHVVVDVGTTDGETSVDYPDFAHAVAGMVESGEAERGLLVCGTGLGVCMAANRHHGVRGAVATTPHLAEMSRRHNDANVLCLAGRILSEEEAWAVTEVWMATPFEGGRHARRVAGIEGEGQGG
ncbi:MAG: ribose 5-phosphate isomerase B, partial [Thermoleophilia bacterium]|nr:ribose 5-phosphate isomerase B [Thermoleophilia bacterium]